MAEKKNTVLSTTAENKVINQFCYNKREQFRKIALAKTQYYNRVRGECCPSLPVYSVIYRADKTQHSNQIIRKISMEIDVNVCVYLHTHIHN